MDNEKIIWDFLQRKKISDYAVAGIMGNLYAESGLNPINLQDTFEKSLGMTDEEYTAAVDNGSYKNFAYDSAGYGLAQWTYYSRKEDLLLFAKNSNTSIGDLRMQLNFFWKELQNYVTISELNKASSVMDASNLILLNYERPADQSSMVKSKRAEFGINFYNKYGSEEVNLNKTDFREYKVKVVADILNYRNGPGINNLKCGTIRKDEVYTIVETSVGLGSSRWGKLKSGAGWIALDYTKRV